MAKGDDVLNLIIAASEMLNTIAKNVLKIVKILRKKSGRQKKENSNLTE